MALRSVFLVGNVLVAFAVRLPAQTGISVIVSRADVQGVVIDESHVPIPAAEVRLEQGSDSGRSIRTGTDGIFLFTDVPEGEATLFVRRLGYAPVAVRVNAGSSDAARRVEVTLKAVPRELTDVVVLGQDSRLREFYKRRNAHSSGTYITQADLQKVNARFTSDIFRRMPGASLRSAGFGNAIRLRGCRPKVWMDGVPMRDIELDELTTPAQVAGLEVYASTAGIPAEYMDVEPRPCGVILVWTRVD